MNKLKALPHIVLAILIIAGIAASPREAAGRGNSQTTLISQWLRIRGNRTCLFFDAQGPRPMRIGPASDTGISVFFSKMAVRLRDRSYKEGKTAVKQIQFRRGSGFFEVLFRWKNTSVTYNVRNGKHGRYILRLILTPPAVKNRAPAPSDEPKTVDFVPNRGKITPQVEIAKVKTSELFGARISTQARDAFANKLKAAKAGVPPKAKEPKSGTAPFVEPDKNGLALYARANEKFEECSRNLIFCASDVIEAYRQALKTGPRSSQAPGAIYRSGLAFYVMGNYVRAEKLFRTVTSQWPDNPAACRCWIGIGDISLKKEAYIEAMTAYQWATRSAIGKKDEAAADYALGKSYLILGVGKEALDMLQECLAREPDYYTRNPRVLRLIGEADFALGDLDNAKRMLLRYVNCQETDPDQDMVLAKIAEIFLKQGQTAAAKKMYGFVNRYYTNSEGDIICQIRAAELMEKVDSNRALAVYDGLRGRDLSPSLRTIVLVKRAELELKKCDIEQGLSLMDEAFPLKADGIPPGIAAIRQRMLCDLVRQYYSNKNFDRIVKLVAKYQGIFDTINLPETLEEIAESYARQKLYSLALKTYDKLLSQQHGMNLDGLLLRCADYALSMQDYDRAFHYCQAAQSGVLEFEKEEILGQIHYRNEQYGNAVSCFENALKARGRLDIREPDSYAALGYSLYQMKRYGEAVPMLKTALLRATLDNDTRRSMLLTLSDCFKEQKHYGQAADIMETAIRISRGEEQSELLYRLSKLYVAAGKSDLAVQSLNRIKAANDTFWSAVAQQELNTLKIAAGTGGKRQ